MTIATLIMEITRRLPNAAKAKVETYCKGVLTKRVNKISLEEYKMRDLLRVENVTNLKFTKQNCDVLLNWYNVTCLSSAHTSDQDILPGSDQDRMVGNFHNFYSNKLKEIYLGEPQQMMVQSLSSLHQLPEHY